MSQPRLIRSPRTRTPDQPKRSTRRVPITARIVAELDRADNLPLRVGFRPGPLTGFAEGRTYVELARAVYDTPEPTVAQVKAVARAAKRLVEAGQIERSRASEGVVVRRNPTKADYESRADVERRAREWADARAEAEANAIAYPVDTGSGIEAVNVEPVLVIRDGGVELRQPQEFNGTHDEPLGRLARMLAIFSGGGS